MSSVRKAKLYGCYHPEAFCLMQYRDDVTGEVEVIWNSRDQVTPFGILSRAGNHAQHVNFEEDDFRPGYVPRIGERVFVPVTVERAKLLAEKWYDRYASAPEFARRFPDRDNAIIEHALARMGDACPDVVEVDKAVIDRLYPVPFLDLYTERKRLLDELRFQDWRNAT